MMKKDVKQMIKDRNIAMKSLDKETIVDYMQKYIPFFRIEKIKDKTFWGAVHKARCEIYRYQAENPDEEFPENEKLTEEDYTISREWLKKHNLSEKIY